jgi:hypothetical protein
MDIDENNDEEGNDDGDIVDSQTEWEAEAYITNANYHMKKMVFLLFINRTSQSFYYFFRILYPLVIIMFIAHF